MRLVVQGVGRRVAAPLRPPLDARRGARRPPRGDRPRRASTAPRSRRRSAARRCTSCPSRRSRSTRAMRRSISARRRATSWRSRSPTATFGARRRACAATGRASQPAARQPEAAAPSAVGRSLCREHGGAQAKFVLVRCLGGLDYWRYGLERLRRRLPGERHRSSPSCPATTGPTRAWRPSPPRRPRWSRNSTPISAPAASATCSGCCAASRARSASRPRPNRRARPARLRLDAGARPRGAGSRPGAPARRPRPGAPARLPLRRSGGRHARRRGAR